MLLGLQLRSSDVSYLLTRSVPRNQRGFNLLEVVVASLIFVTVLVFMLGLWTAYHSALTQSRHRLVANGLARSVMEQRVANGHGALNSIIDDPQVQEIVSNSQIRGRQLQTKFETRFLATDPGGPNTALRRITVTVSWEEDTGEKSLTYESCLFKSQ